MEKAITINVFDFNSGDYLHCFDGASEIVRNGEVLEFDYTIKNLGIVIENAEFHVDWCSKEENGKQVALVTLIPNSGKLFLSNDLKSNMNDVIKSFIKTEKMFKAIGMKEDSKKITSARNAILNFLKNVNVYGTEICKEVDTNKYDERGDNKVITFYWIVY